MKKRANNMGQRIREKRIELGWTQGQLSKKTGYSRIYILKVEKGQVESPGIKALEKIRSCLGMTWEDLWK